MRDPRLDHPVVKWLQEAMLLAIAESGEYFELVRQANIDGTPEEGLQPLYELDERLCTLLGNMPDAPVCEGQVPILRRIVVRCDMAIASTWIQLFQQNPDLPEFREKALLAAKEQIDFLSSIPDYDIASDDELPEELRLGFVQLARAFAK